VKRFLVDNQLPAALAQWLQSRDCHADHVLALNLGQSSDSTIWAFAATHRAIIVSKDEDFAQLTVMRTESVPVIWLRFGNCPTPTLLAKMERV
jgi:predicted nuclease of predicted toxin-antitoxin system